MRSFAVITGMLFAVGMTSSSLATEPERLDWTSRDALTSQDNGGDVSGKVDAAYGAYQRGYYLTAFNLALTRAEAGDAAAQTLIAEMFDLGRGVRKDTKTAAQWYEVAANSGNREAQFSFAMKLLEGRDVERDKKRAFDLIEAAADAGHPLAMFNHAMHLIEQRPTSAGYKRALTYLEKAAEYRLGDAYYALAKIVGEGLATGIGNPEKGRQWLERAAKTGVDTAQVDLAMNLLAGVDGPKDEKQAARWFEAAARGGNVIAQNRLAHLKFDGKHVKEDKLQAAKWYVLSSRAGRADPELHFKFSELDEKTRKEALALANRWPY